MSLLWVFFFTFKKLNGKLLSVYLLVFTDPSLSAGKNENKWKNSDPAQTREKQITNLVVGQHIISKAGPQMVTLCVSQLPDPQGIKTRVPEPHQFCSYVEYCAETAIPQEKGSLFRRLVEQGCSWRWMADEAVLLICHIPDGTP